MLCLQVCEELPNATMLLLDIIVEPSFGMLPLPTQSMILSYRWTCADYGMVLRADKLYYDHKRVRYHC